MVLDETALEHRLLLLGRAELSIEQNLQKLRVAGRAAAQQGQLDEADEVWNLFEALRVELRSLQSEITLIERDLYGLRSRRRK